MSRVNIAGISAMNNDAIIDYVIRKPIQKNDFNEIFNKILIQMHLSHN